MSVATIGITAVMGMSGKAASKAFRFNKTDIFLTVLRYVLRNPLRARLVDHPAHWPWSSWRVRDVVDPWPVEPAGEWESWLVQPLFDHELHQLRQCVNRQAPFGTVAWQQHLAITLGLESTLRRRGRPRRESEK